MGKAKLYTVKDYLTGEVLAKGRAGELEASSIVPRGYHTSEWAKRENNRTMGRKYNIGSELLHPEDSPRRGEKGRTLNVYTCYDAAGNVMGEGTSRELWEAGVFGDDNGAYYACAEGQKAGAARPAEDKRPDAAGLRRPRPDDLQRHRQKRGPTGADLRLLGGGGKAGKAIKVQTGKPPMGNHRGVFDKKYKARWVLPRRLGGRHIGLYKSEPLSVPVGLWPRENAAPLGRGAFLK